MAINLCVLAVHACFSFKSTDNIPFNPLEGFFNLLKTRKDERETETETDTETEREKQTETDRETEDRETETDREKEQLRDREKTEKRERGAALKTQIQRKGHREEKRQIEKTCR